MSDVIDPRNTVAGYEPFNYLARDFKRLVDGEDDLDFGVRLGLLMGIKILDEVISENRKSSKARKAG